MRARALAAHNEEDQVSRLLALLHLLLWQEQRDLVGFPRLSGLSEAADQQFAHFTEHQWLLLIG